MAIFDPAGSPGSRIKVQGVVSLVLPGQGFFLQDATGGLRIRTQNPANIRLGDSVEVLGFPAFGDFSPRLEEAIVRSKESGSLPTPNLTTAANQLATPADESVEGFCGPISPEIGGRA